MRELIFEYMNYIVAVVSATVSISVGVLFYIAYQRHKTQHTFLRSVGFFLIGESFGFHLFERIFPDLAVLAFVFEVAGLLTLYYALLINREVGQVFYSEVVFENRPKPLVKINQFIRFLVSTIIISATFYFIINQLTGSTHIVLSTLIFSATIICFAIMIEQYKRLVASDKSVFFQNLIVLVGFAFIELRLMLSVSYFFPPDVGLQNYADIVNPNGRLWLAISIVTLIAFLCIAVWQWGFVKRRFFIRIIEILLSLSILMAILSSLVILISGSQIVQSSNFDIVTNNSKLVSTTLKGKFHYSSDTADLLSYNQEIYNLIKTGDKSVLKTTSKIIDNIKLNADYGRIYDLTGKIVLSPFDPSLEGTQNDDPFLKEVIKRGRETITYFLDTENGQNILVARDANPIYYDDEMIGIISMRFKIDNEFLESIKDVTNVDLIVYTGSLMSSSTVHDTDIINSRVLDATDVQQKVLQDNQVLSKVVTFGEKDYYANYTPLAATDGHVVGIITSLKERLTVTDEFKKQLIISFVIITNIAFALTYFSYMILRRGYFEDVKEGVVMS